MFIDRKINYNLLKMKPNKENIYKFNK